MMPVNPLEQSHLFEFGPFRLDTRARLLFRDGIPVPLPPKSYETLVHLVRSGGRAMTREELAEAVWPDVVVSDGSLTQAVFLLRKALGESEEGPRFIETVPRVGYRFAAGVAAVSPAVASAPAEARAPGPDSAARGVHPRLAFAAGAALVLAVLAAAGVWLLRAPARAPGARPGLLTERRELPIPADASRLLGHVGSSFVLAAPGATYLLPDDGALAATRIPLGGGETLADLARTGLVVVRGDDVVTRDPIGQKQSDSARLPAGLGAAARSLLVSPGGRHLALRTRDAIEVLELSPGRAAPAFRRTLAARETEVLALTDRYLAVAPGGGAPLEVIELEGGRTVLTAPCAELRPEALAVDDATGRVAVGGRFDSIHVFAIGGAAPPLTLPGRGWTHGLAFVPDAPTLLASGYGGFVAYRGAEVVHDARGRAAAGTVTAGSDGVFVLSTKRQRLTWLDYAGFAPAARVDLHAQALWSIEHDAADTTVYAGGRDGKLYALDLATSRVRTASVHTDGIPSLLREGAFLASASDDKSVAVWELPGPKLVRRATAHRYLVNDLRVAPRAPDGPTLVTSSSDGTVKTWTWPSLEPKETIDVAALTGRTSELHAVWTAPDLTRVLVGTWDGALVDIANDGALWTARRVPVEGGAVYRFASLPKLGLVAGVAIVPHEVFLYDLARGTAHAIESAGLEAYWCVADEEASALFVAGDGGVSRYAFARDGDTVRYELAARRRSGLSLMSVTRLAGGALWAATYDGALVKIAPETFGGFPPARGRVELAPAP